MKILLDEQVPEPVLTPLTHMLREHEIDHVQRIGWKRKKDRSLLTDVKTRRYDVFVTADLAQLDDPDECTLIRKGGFHHVRFQRYGRGVAMTASAIATVVAGLPAALSDLEQADGQRLVLLKLVRCGQGQFELCDPMKNPPAYWKATGQVERRPKRPPGPRTARS